MKCLHLENKLIGKWLVNLTLPESNFEMRFTNMNLPFAMRSSTSKSFFVVMTAFVMIQKFSIPINMTTYGKISLKQLKDNYKILILKK